MVFFGFNPTFDGFNAGELISKPLLTPLGELNTHAHISDIA